MSVTERQLIDDVISYIDDPLGFVLYAFPWGEKNTPLEKYPLGPDQWHIDMFTSMAERISDNREALAHNQDLDPVLDATTSGHGIGKSACVAWIVIWLCSTRSVKGVVTANTGQQLEGKTWQELKKWHGMAVNSHWFKWTATKFTSLLDKLCVVECVPWSIEKPEAFAGLHNEGKCVLLLMDEASAIDDVIFEVAEGALTDGSAEIFWILFGNPTRNTGRFRECFPPGRFANLWTTRSVDSRTVRITNKKQIDKWIDTYGDDSDFARIRIKGQFPRSATNQFISGNDARQAMERTNQPNPDEEIVIGCDVARFGSNETIIGIRRGRRVKQREIYRYQGLGNVEVANELMAVIEKCVPRADAVNIDGAGVGGGVVDILRNRGYRVNDVQAAGVADKSEFYANKRAEMWGNVKEWLQTGDIPDDEEIFRQLISPEYGFDKKNRILIESKDDMVKRGVESPDIADMLGLTLAVKIVSEAVRESGQWQQQVAIVDYDILDTQF